MVRHAILTILAAAALASAQPNVLIRANDLAGLREWMKTTETGAAAAIDDRGNQPLHYAALYGSVESVEILLKAGASANAKNNDGITPLIYAGTSAAKTQLMLAHEADVNAAAAKGRTALHVAVAATEGLAVARLLLARNADVNAVDFRGDTPLTLANPRHVELIRLLLSKGAKAKVANKVSFTPLMHASSLAMVETVRLLLAAGADPRVTTMLEGSNAAGKVAQERRTALLLAAPSTSIDVVRDLLRAGADPHARDIRGFTPLIVAVSGDNQNPQLVRALLDAGSDVNAHDINNETVLDWARKTPHPEVLRLLEEAGARSKSAPPAAPAARTEGAAPPLPDALARAMRLIEGSSPQFFKKAACVACHHQPPAIMAAAAMRNAGLPFDRAAAEAQIKPLTLTNPPDVLQGIEFGAKHDSTFFVLLALLDWGQPASAHTDLMVHYLSYTQNEDGSWGRRSMGGPRPPVDDADIRRTAAAVGILRKYGWPARQAEFERAVARGRAWLERAKPVAEYEHSELVMGLVAAGSSHAATAAQRLAELQQPSGGWRQSVYLAPDAYATSLALHALRTAGMAVTDPVYAKGVKYLREAQLDDGSWYVASRAPKFQPYFQSGFPHNHDQWLSIIATAYAVRALAPAAESVSHASNHR